MFNNFGQVMVYVNDTEKVAKFWRDQAGFSYVKQVEGPGGYSYEIAPSQDADFQMVLHNRAAVEAMNPEMDYATPSILLTSSDVQALYDYMVEHGAKDVNPVQEQPFRHFNFPDPEGNYFAVREV